MLNYGVVTLFTILLMSFSGKSGQGFFFLIVLIILQFLFLAIGTQDMLRWFLVMANSVVAVLWWRKELIQYGIDLGRRSQKSATGLMERMTRGVRHYGVVIVSGVLIREVWQTLVYRSDRSGVLFWFFVWGSIAWIVRDDLKKQHYYRGNNRLGRSFWGLLFGGLCTLTVWGRYRFEGDIWLWGGVVCGRVVMSIFLLIHQGSIKQLYDSVVWICWTGMLMLISVWLLFVGLLT